MTSETIVRVGDVMTASPRVIDGLASVREAIEVMRAENLGALISDQRHEADEYGMVGMHEIAEQVIGIDRSVGRTSVYEIMSKPVLTVDKQMAIKYALRLLTRFRLTRALVVEHGSMVGIVTLGDMVLRAAELDTA